MCLDLPLQPALTVVAAAPFPEGSSNPRGSGRGACMGGFVVEAVGCRWLSTCCSPRQPAARLCVSCGWRATVVRLTAVGASGEG
jgi:hypothetical protein